MIKTKSQQATRIQTKIHQREVVWQRFLKFSYLFLLLSFLLWGWEYLKDPQTLPIKTVKIASTLNFVEPVEIKKTLAPYIQAGFFSVDLSAIKSHLEELPWVKTVSIRRVWPATLVIDIEEQDPIAMWKKGALINSNGALFYPNPQTFPEGLPTLTGPEEKQQKIFQLFQNYSKALASIKQNIHQFIMDDRHSVILILNKGLKVILGNQNRSQRLAKFIGIYSKVFVGKINRVKYVDLRYTNGMAVRWQNEAMVE